MDREDILARLLDGDTVENIAEELAKTINEAKKEYDNIQEQEAKAREEEELAKAKEEEAKREEELQAEIDKRVYLVQQMENAVMDYIAECHPDLYNKMASGSIDAENALDIASSIDTMCAMLEMLL